MIIEDIENKIYIKKQADILSAINVIEEEIDSYIKKDKRYIYVILKELDDINFNKDILLTYIPIISFTLSIISLILSISCKNIIVDYMYIIIFFSLFIIAIFCMILFIYKGNSKYTKTLLIKRILMKQKYINLL